MRQCLGQDHEHWVLPGATVRQVRGPRLWMGLRPGRRLQLVEAGPWWTPSGDNCLVWLSTPPSVPSACRKRGAWLLRCAMAGVASAACFLAVDWRLTATQALSRPCRLEGGSLQPQSRGPAGLAGGMCSRDLAAWHALSGLPPLLFFNVFVSLSNSGLKVWQSHGQGSFGPAWWLSNNLPLHGQNGCRIVARIQRGPSPVELAFWACLAGPCEMHLTG